MHIKFFEKKKKVIAVFLTLVFLFPLLSRPIMAFSSPTHPGKYLPNFEAATVKTDEMNLQSFVFETMKAVGGSIFYAITGCMSCSPEEREDYPGFIFGNLIAAAYLNPPASGVKYFAKVSEKIGITKPAYAQGTGKGFETMEVILPIWTAFRNISYVFLVLILVFMGFAIMFRVKINPQTVISIQSVFPRVILGIVLITFSYAIVGIMIDLMYLLLIFVSNLFVGDENSLVYKLPGWGPELAIKAKNFFTSLYSGLSDIFGNRDKLIETMIGNSIFFFLVANMAFFAILFLGPIPFIISIIAAILIFIALLRVAWVLLKTYVNMVVLLIFAPFQILIGILPGSKAIGTWFRNVLANILVWPTILIMMFLGTYLILAGIASMFDDFGSWILSALSAIGFTAPALVLEGYGFFVRLFLPFVGLGIILMAPKAAEMIKAFMTEKPFEFGTAIGESFRPASFAIGTGWGVAKDLGGTYIRSRVFPVMKGKSKKIPSKAEELAPGSGAT